MNIILILIKKLVRKHMTLIKYLLFGGLTTLINIAAYTILYQRLGITNIMSTIIAWVIAVIFAFITNKLSVFNSKRFDHMTLLYEAFSFFGARIITGIIDTGIMYLSVDVFHLNEIIWKIISNILVIFLNYIASTFFVFKKSQNNKK